MRLALARSLLLAICDSPPHTNTHVRKREKKKREGTHCLLFLHTRVRLSVHTRVYPFLCLCFFLPTVCCSSPATSVVPQQPRLHRINEHLRTRIPRDNSSSPYSSLRGRAWLAFARLPRLNVSSTSSLAGNYETRKTIRISDLGLMRGTT